MSTLTSYFAYAPGGPLLLTKTRLKKLGYHSQHKTAFPSSVRKPVLRQSYTFVVPLIINAHLPIMEKRCDPK